MARPRLIFVAASISLCAAGLASSSPALGPSVSQAAQRRAIHRSTRTHHAPRCARAASFHTRHSGSRARHGHCPAHRGAKRQRRRRSFHAHSHRARHARHVAHHRFKGPRTGPAKTTPDAANATACADAELTPTTADIERVRAATLCLVNRERAAHGVGPLSANADLEQSAQSHTTSMAFEDYFEHDGPSGDTPASRMRAAGYIYSSRIGYEVGENIGWGTLWLATPKSIVAAWMASPGHRANILDASYRDTGIGVSAHPPQSLAHGQPGAVYTQDFGVIVTG